MRILSQILAGMKLVKNLAIIEAVKSGATVGKYFLNFPLFELFHFCMIPGIIPVARMEDKLPSSGKEGQECVCL